MPAKVFISCGQATSSERAAAAEIEKWFSDRGFEPYVAIQAQSLADVNSGIIDKLKAADYYVFVDFRRERLIPTVGFINPLRSYPYRGSLFTNQELAAVFILQFEKAIFLRQDGVEVNGLMRYMGSNATIFRNTQEIAALVAEHATNRSWQPTYTRHLELGQTRWSAPLTYYDHTGQRDVRVFYVDVHNRRRDIGGLSAIARLRSVEPQSGELDRSPLKCTGQPGYSQVVWPESHCSWDFLAVDMSAPSTIYLNSALDSVPRQPIIAASGEYLLRYEVFAENFPLLTFELEVVAFDDPAQTSATVRPAA
jgi:hypothetical protein